VVRRLGDSVWEAVQPELDRRVALRRLPEGTALRTVAWPDRAGVVNLYAVVEDASGTYVVTRFVPGARTLAELGGVRSGRRHRWLDQVAATLEGTVHGDLTDADILIDASGRALVTGFGRAAPDATPADDAAAIARLRPVSRPRNRFVVIGGAAAVAVGAAVLILATRGSEAPPPVPSGAIGVGSPLRDGPVASVDCEDRPPGGDSVACSILQGDLAGRTLVVPSAGIVRAWSVRGARGQLQLQVLVPDGPGFRQAGAGPVVTIPDTGVQVVATDLSVPAGARFALGLAPGSAVGLRNDVAGARTLRFYGALRGDPRVPDDTRGAGQELLLRVDVAPRG